MITVYDVPIVLKEERNKMFKSGIIAQLQTKNNIKNKKKIIPIIKLIELIIKKNRLFNFFVLFNL